MAQYTLKRLLQFLPTLVIASIFVFLVMANAPGDPARIRLGQEATEEQVAAERERLGLNDSFPERYVIWVADVARLDFGQSFQSNRSVIDEIVPAFGRTARLAAAAATIGIVLGLAFGIIAALSRGKPLDTAISAVSALLLSVPSFVSGMLLILLFAVRLKWLPPSGEGEPGDPVDALRSLVLPALALGLQFAAILARFMRGALIEVLGQDYVLTARAKGLSPATVVRRHEVRNALIPTVTIIGIGLGSLFAGTVVTETVFSYPGLGRLIITALSNRDYPVVQAGLILASAVFLAMSLLADLLYGILDPRIVAGGAP